MRLLGVTLQHHVARRHRDRGRRAGRRRDRRGRERTRSSSMWERSGRTEDYHRVRHRRRQGGRRPELLLAARDRRRRSCRSSRSRRRKGGCSSRSPTRRTSPCRRRAARHHARPGAAPAVHAHDGVRLPAALAGAASRTRCSSARIHPEETHPISRVLIRRLRAGLPLGAALAVASSSPAPSRWSSPPSRSTCGSARSSCRRSTKARSSTCRRRCPASR